MDPLLARLGEMQFLGAPVGGGRRDPDQPVALERQDVAAERGAVHHHLRGERVDGQRTLPLELRQNRELVRAQAGGREELIIRLGDVARRRAHGVAVAFGGAGFHIGRHFRPR